MPHQILASEAQLVAALERHNKEGLRLDELMNSSLLVDN